METIVYEKNLEAYNRGIRIIANKGGTRSSKTFSILQLLAIILLSSLKKRIITVVSHSFPHLSTGAIRDFDNILIERDINPDSIRTKHPYVYTYNNTILEFIGFDKPGKTLGAARDILFINEANRMPFNICHQLIQRTTECIFMDWNPSNEFWFDTEGFEDRKDCKVIHSTYKDNFANLAEGHKAELLEASRKANIEIKKNVKGYWYNYWQVYGLGLQGMLEGVIFHNWKTYKQLPEDLEFYKMFVIDWGGNDPTTLAELNINGKFNKIYIREIIYQPQILNSKLITKIYEVNQDNNLVIYDSARKDKGFELQMAGIKAIGATKGEGSVIDGLDKMQEFDIFIHEDSKNAIKEFSSYCWAKDRITGKSLNEPEDNNNHIVDPVRYGVRYYKRNIKP